MNEQTILRMAGAYLIACILLGGASAAGAFANALLQMVGLIIILILLWRADPFPAGAATPIWIGAAFLLIGLLTLVPLPPSVWAGIPFRDYVANGYRLLGMGLPSAPLTLAPGRTTAALLSLLPAAAMFLLVVQLSGESRRRLAVVLLVMAALSILLGAFQLMGGPQSRLRFYDITNPNAPVAFFANPNHQGTLLLCAMPFTAVLAARAARGPRAKRGGGMILSMALAFLITVGVAISGSTAAYAMFLPVAYGSVLIYRRSIAGRLGWQWRAGLVVLLAAFIVIGIQGPLSTQSLTTDVREDPASRRVLNRNTLAAAADAFPVGSGLGTFPAVYRLYEDPDRISANFANHAHNDYAEVALELSLAGIALIAGFFLWWGRQTLRLWSSDLPEATIARAGTLSIGVVLLHSLVDYPIRTAAITAVFAMSCALLVPGVVRRSRASAEAASRETLRHIEA